MEKWKPVVGYEGRYEVSDQGRVRSLPLVVAKPGRAAFIHPLSNRVLRQACNRRGYKLVMLHSGTNKDRRTTTVHRLVCEAFHGPSPAGRPHALHGDGNPANNVPENLRWGSHDENLKEAVRHGSIRSGERHPRAKLSDAEVAVIRQLHAEGSRYKAIAARFGLHWCYVQKLVLGTMRAEPSVAERLSDAGKHPPACR
jgi:hypothetical protein